MIYIIIILLGIGAFITWMCELCGITHISQWSHSTTLGHITFIFGFCWLAFQLVNGVIKGFRKLMPKR